MMATKGTRLLTACLFALLVLAAGTAGAGGPYDRVVVFGDSLSDPGNAFVLLGFAEVPPFDSLIPDAPYARGGHHFSNGETWVELLAKRLHLGGSAGPALRAPGVFSNYAVGGARARLAGPFDLTGQVQRFLADVNHAASPASLYVVWVGGNDLRDALVALPADPTGTILAALGAIQSNVIELYLRGARTFLVPNPPDLGLVPAVRRLGPVAQFAATQLSVAFRDGLTTLLDGLAVLPGITIVRVNVFELLNDLNDDPAAAGLVDAQHSCITPLTVVDAFCRQPDDFLFWDGIHPTRAGHAILADEAHAALSAP